MGLTPLMLLLEQPFQPYGTELGVGSTGEARWLSQPHQVFTQQCGNLWTNEECGMIFFQRSC